jgi:uncharacterized protein (TIGR02996 family)
MARKRTPPKKERSADQPIGPRMTARERTELDARLARMLSKPIRSELGDGRFSLLWTERDDTGAPETMMWRPETKEELRGATLFFEAANNLGAFARLIQKGQPVRRAPEHAAFIAGILANRTDDTGYLAYADYLTEHGNSQGDLIRLCIELDKLPPDGPEAAEKNARLNELCEAHLDEWFAPLGELGLRPVIWGTFAAWLWLSIRTGVMEKVTIDRPGILPESASRLFAAAPFLRVLKYELGHVNGAGLARVKQLSQIEELDLGHTDMTLDDLRGLLRSRYLTGLKVLNLAGNEFGPAGAEELVAWPGLAKLEVLDLWWCALGSAGIAHLTASPALGTLARLRIGRNDHKGLALASLLHPARLGRLTELGLSGTVFDQSTSALFATAGCAKTLTDLDLDDSTFQPGALAAFARCRFPALRVLKLNYVALGGPVPGQLARAPFTQTLEELYLDNCRLGTGAEDLFQRGKFPNLKVLDVSRNRLQQRGARALARSARNFPALTDLRLWDNQLGAEAVQELAKSKVCEHLTNLDIHGNNIAPTGALALANSKYLTKLGALVVDEKAVGKKGKQALLEAFGEQVVSFR